MRRFYKQASVGEAEDGQGSTVTLDGRPVRTPGKRLLVLPSAKLAEAVASEWQEQGEEIDPDSMVMMSYATTAVDRVTPQRDAVIDEVADYAGSDLLCYRAEEPDDLVVRQQKIWHPLLDWCEVTYGARLEVTSGIMPLRQSDEALAALRAAVAEYEDMRLGGLHALTSGLGSVVVALAVASGRISAEEGFAVAQLDETFQIERWGEDAEVAERRANLHRDMLAAAKFIQLCAD